MREFTTECFVMLGCIDRGGVNKVSLLRRIMLIIITMLQNLSLVVSFIYLVMCYLNGSYASLQEYMKNQFLRQRSCIYGLFRFCSVCLQTCNAFLSPACAIYMRDTGKNFLYSDLYTVALGEMAFSLNCSYLDLNNCSCALWSDSCRKSVLFLQYFFLSYFLVKK